MPVILQVFGNDCKFDKKSELIVRVQYRTSKRRKRRVGIKPSLYLIMIQIIIIILMRTSSKQVQKRGPTCTICMQRTSNSSINGCSHQFCLRCIKKWSRTKNTCPLCRERFIRIEHKNRLIQVENIPERTRPQRIPFISHQAQQQGLVYVPMLIYPQNTCIFYTAQSNIFLHSGVGSQQSMTFSIGSPTFFMPVV